MYEKPNLFKEINIVASYKCNNNCLFCCEGWHRKFPEKTTIEIKNDLTIAKQNNVNRVIFMGGEPSIRKDIIDLVSFSKKLQFKEIFLITNGRMFSNKSFTDNIINAGMTHVVFSLLSSSKEIHDSLTRSPGSFDQLIQGLRNVKQYNEVIVGINTCIIKQNYEHLPDLVEYLTQPLLYPKFIGFILVNPYGNAWDNFDNIVPKLSEIKPFIHEAINIGLKSKIKVTAEAVPFCYMKGYEKHVTELHMSEERIKNTPKGTKHDLNKARQEVKVKGSQCKKCKFDPVCEGIWNNYAKQYGLKELIPIPGDKINNWTEFRKHYFQK